MDEHYRGRDSSMKASRQNYGEQRDPHQDTRDAMPSPVAAYPASSPPPSLHRSSRTWPAFIVLSRIVALVLFVAISIATALSSANWLSAAGKWRRRRVSRSSWDPGCGGVSGSKHLSRIRGELGSSTPLLALDIFPRKAHKQGSRKWRRTWRFRATCST
jgi:hypothetical protein